MTMVSHGHGDHVADVHAETEPRLPSAEPERCWATPAFLVPSVLVKLPRRKGRR